MNWEEDDMDTDILYTYYRHVMLQFKVATYIKAQQSARNLAAGNFF
jgi:hypothetical protein